MRNLILNINATGSWEELPLGNGIRAIKMRGRSANILYRYTGQEYYFTILSTDHPHVLRGNFNPGDIQISGTGVVEVEFGTQSDFA